MTNESTSRFVGTSDEFEFVGMEDEVEVEEEIVEE